MTGRALLTGGSGFVGAHLARRLAADGWALHALVRAGSDPARLLSAAPEAVVHVVGPDAAAVAEAVAAAAPDVCWHLATHFRATHVLADVDPLLAGNVAFGARVAEGLALAHVPVLVNTGTAWQHHDSAEYAPTSLYAATKQAFESIVRYYTDTGAFRAVHLRLFDTYGPEDPRGKLISLLLERARTGEPLPMSPGEQLIDLVHVEDVVAALLRAAELDEGASATYQVATSAPRTLRELAGVVADVTGRPLPIRWGERPYRPREMMTPWRAAPDLPGWQPAIALEDGVRRLWEAEARDP